MFIFLEIVENLFVVLSVKEIKLISLSNNCDLEGWNEQRAGFFLISVHKTVLLPHKVMS